MTSPGLDRGLDRGLGAWAASALVVGTIIGTGVFLKTAVMTQLGGSAGWVLVAWASAGALSLAGALTYAELGAMLPEAGGEYVYLREGYGRGLGFLYGWTRFWIGAPGSIAAYAVGTATFIGDRLPITGVPLAILVIAMFTAINCANVRAGGRLMTALTALKVALILGLAFGALFGATHGEWARVVATGGFPGWSPFGAMILAALWAYDGWNNLPMAAGEVRDPGRVLPRALVLGSLGVFAIYALINVAYFYALPIADVASSSSTLYPHAPPIAEKVASQFLGTTTQVVLAGAMALSALSALNGSILTNARIPYAMALDRLMPRVLAKLSARGRVPIVAVIVQGVWSSVLAASGKFDELTNAVVFASWLFYALNAGSVILLRRRAPERPRPFRVPGYPVVPIVFVVLAALLLANSLFTAPKESAFGVAVMVLGGAWYGLIVRPRQ